MLGRGRGERFVGRLICRRRVCGILFPVCMSCLRGRGLRELYGIVVSDPVLILRLPLSIVHCPLSPAPL